MDRIKSPADNGDPHDPCLTSSAEESFLNTCCFNSSRPSPVTDEILIICTSFCLHQRCSFADLLGIATSIFVATAIVGFSGRLGIVFGKLSSRWPCTRSTGSCSLNPETSTRCSRSRATIDVPQKLSAESVPEMRAFNQSRNIGHDEGLVHVDRHDAELRFERRKRIIRNLRTSGGNAGNQRGFSGVWDNRQARHRRAVSVRGASSSTSPGRPSCARCGARFVDDAKCALP